MFQHKDNQISVFSENEWDNLKVVIVGSTLESVTNDIDISFKLFFKKETDWGYPTCSTKQINIKKKYIEELNEDIEEFSNTLEKNNILVLRPNKLPNLQQKIQSIYWNSISYPCLNVRDQSIIIGNTIVETSPCQRGRYFENDLLKDIYLLLFKSGANWLKMPTSTLKDDSFDTDMTSKKTNKIIANKNIKMENDDLFANFEDIFNNNSNSFFEPMLDGANFIRFNKDIIVNINNRNQLTGLQWFKRNFPDYNFHPITSFCHNHLDSHIVPLNNETLLLRNKTLENYLPKFLKDYKKIYCPEPSNNIFPKYEDDDIMLASKYIDINVLSISPKKVICNSLFPDLCEILYKNNFEVIPVRHRHRRIFSGGFHCFTLDILRTRND